MLKVTDTRKQVHKDLAKVATAFVKSGGKITICSPSKRRSLSNRGYRK